MIRFLRIQFSNSSRQLTPSLPGIAVRRTASLPLAYARQSIFFEMVLRRWMDARAIQREDALRALARA
jgi:hypothetical protein